MPPEVGRLQLEAAIESLRAQIANIEGPPPGSRESTAAIPNGSTDRARRHSAAELDRRWLSLRQDDLICFPWTYGGAHSAAVRKKCRSAFRLS